MGGPRKAPLGGLEKGPSRTASSGGTTAQVPPAKESKEIVRSGGRPRSPILSHFLLSPGITPELTDVVVILVPIAIGLGYLLGAKRGFEIAFAASAVALGAIKLVTDFADLPDLLVALGAMVGGALWAVFAAGRQVRSIGIRLLVLVIGAGVLVLGIIKLRDFYDPFDLLLADTMIVAGVALALRAHLGARFRYGPASSPPPPA